ADRRPQPAQPRRGGVEQLAHRVEAASERRAQGRQCVELTTELTQQRPALIRERRGQAGRRVERLGELEELARVEPATARRALDRRTDVVRGSDPDARSLLEQGPSLIGLLEAARDDDRVARRLE